jgi:hypothetical protein
MTSFLGTHTLWHHSKLAPGLYVMKDEALPIESPHTPQMCDSTLMAVVFVSGTQKMPLPQVYLDEHPMQLSVRTSSGPLK